MRLDKAKDCSIQKYLETSSEYCILVQFETRSRERIAVLPDKVACNDTLPAVSIEKVVCMKTKDELFQKVRFDSESTAGFIKIELTNWSTRSTRAGRKNIL